MRWRLGGESRRGDHTDDVIAAAERTRKDLKRLTNELAEYTADLRARIPLLDERRERAEEGPSDGGA